MYIVRHTDQFGAQRYLAWHGDHCVLYWSDHCTNAIVVNQLSGAKHIIECALVEEDLKLPGMIDIGVVQFGLVPDRIKVA